MRIEQLAEAIQIKRDEMIKIGVTKGLRDQQTIQCSQELDELLNLYWQLSCVSYCSKKSLVRN